MMERDNWPGQVRTSQASFYASQNVLILDQSSTRCTADKCDALTGLLQKSLAVRCIQEQCDNQLPHKVSSVPDVVLVRPAANEKAHQLIASCKQKWMRASILALVCPQRNQLIEDLTSVLTDVDDFLSCPFHESELLLRIRRLLQSKKKKTILPEQLGTSEALHFGALIGHSESFVRAIKNIPPLAQSDATVLLCGETGTGKELFARAIHYHSSRQNKPFIPINCAALPDHLFENELFGHAKGAYTDASSAEKGLIPEAEGGTLILDEVDGLSPVAQAKLLRFLQNGEYRPLGSSRSVRANVRIIAATNADLLARVKAKVFREDLYYRLNALAVFVPPLRERIDDVLRLSNHFLTQYAGEHGQKPRRVSDGALRKLMAYPWPGNVRELEGVILRALVLTTSATLHPEDISLPVHDREALSDSPSLREAKRGVVQAFERTYLTDLLVTHHGNITQAARAAGKQRRALQRLLQKYSLDRNSFQS